MLRDDAQRIALVSPSNCWRYSRGIPDVACCNSRNAPVPSPVATLHNASRDACTAFFSGSRAWPFGIGRERGLETTLQKQCMPEIVMAKGHLGRQLDDLAEGGLGFRQTAELPPDDADIVQGLRARRGPIQGPARRRPSLLAGRSSSPSVPPRLAQAGANPGSKSAARWNDSAALTMSSDAQPQLAALVMRRRPRRRQRQRLVEVARGGVEIVHFHADARGCDQRGGAFVRS